MRRLREWAHRYAYAIDIVGLILIFTALVLLYAYSVHSVCAEKYSMQYVQCIIKEAW